MARTSGTLIERARPFGMLAVRLGCLGALAASACGRDAGAPALESRAAPSTASYAVTVPALRYRDGPIVVLGASYARGLSLEELTERQVLNRGKEGEQSWELAARFDADVVAAAPRAVIVWGFINDIFRSPRDRVEAAVSQARESIRAMVGRARAAGIEPILATEVTIRPRDSWRESVNGLIAPLLRRTSYQTYINGHVLEVNHWMRDYARREAVLLLDLQPVVSDRSGIRRLEFAAPDGSHLSPAGYAALNAYAVPVLRSHLAGTVSR